MIPFLDRYINWTTLEICDRGYPLVATDESNAQLILRIER